MSFEDSGSTDEIDLGMKVRSMIDISENRLDNVNHHNIAEAFLPLYISH